MDAWRLLLTPVRFLAVGVAIVGCLVLWPVLACHNGFWRGVQDGRDAWRDV
jgi:uncharacterized membrane protein